MGCPCLDQQLCYFKTLAKRLSGDTALGGGRGQKISPFSRPGSACLFPMVLLL